MIPLGNVFATQSATLDAPVLAAQTAAAAQITTGQLAAAASIFGGIAGFVGTLTSVLANRWLEYLKSDLSERQTVRKAKLDYEYEARKNLYERCEPAAFRFIRECELSRNRIILLNTLNRSNDLQAWLDGEDNRISTIYRIFAPVATYYQISSLLTSYDLTLAPRLHAIYGLGRLLRDAFVSDRQIASPATGVPLQYAPGAEIEGISPAVHQRQGITYEELETLVTAMTTEKGIIQLPAFVKSYNDVDSPIRKAANGVDHIVRDLVPSQLPVLWRVYFYNLAITTVLFGLMHRQPTSGDFDVEKIFTTSEPEQMAWVKGEGSPVLRLLATQLKQVAAELRIDLARGWVSGKRE